MPRLDSIPALFRQTIEAPFHFVLDRIKRSGDADSTHLEPGEGAIVDTGMGKTALYRDPDGELHELSARCTHLACIVRWNEADGTWDCPCHGSRFEPTGAAEGPGLKAARSRLNCWRGSRPWGRLAVGAESDNRQEAIMKSRTSWLLGAAAAVAATGVMADTAAAKTIARSTFNTAAEGWKVVGDVASDPEKPEQFDTGGDPGGYIQTVDKAVGGIMYWRAPAGYRGNQKDVYKGTLRYSLTQSSASSPINRPDVIIEGGGLVLENSDCCGPPAVFPLWTQYTVSLAKAGWVHRIDGSTTEPATGPQMKTALGDIDALLIRAEYRNGDDTDGLDTVKLKTPPPAR